MPSYRVYFSVLCFIPCLPKHAPIEVLCLAPAHYVATEEFVLLQLPSDPPSLSIAQAILTQTTLYNFSTISPTWHLSSARCFYTLTLDGPHSLSPTALRLLLLRYCIVNSVWAGGMGQGLGGACVINHDICEQNKSKTDPASTHYPWSCPTPA
eukprot:NODE_2664_length_658_cov_101.548440_g2194_i0.p1 GENE.NODE_2664_length_658_cov_101.548440_g2194_i0~~NODE_2664_length_658_cov_101.548440_g2194_i0.p1  ORF type:complete len:153 (-),score=12.70 NODE_2664_length_658_cov_101.548440_g2194_i0:12-470(-)